MIITCWNIIILITGTSLIISAISSYLISQSIVKEKIHENVIIKQNSTAFNFWINPPATILRKYYLFDVKNPKEVEKGEVPQLVQLGPYVYSEIWEKRHIEFLGDNILRFTPVVTLHFEPALSNGKESDLVTFLNVPAVGVIEQTIHSRSKELGPAAVNALLALLNTKLFETKTVGELISGYHDPLMEIAKILLPKVVKDGKFSFLNGKNGTEWQNYSMMTGFDYASNVAKLITWDGQEKLNFWESETANLINGTDGSLYPPFLTKDRKLYSFNPDMCRSYYLTYLRDNEIDGVKTYDFHLPETMFYNSSINPDNKGFCTECFGNGVLNISNCNGGVSGFLSQPHFLNAEEKILKSVKGLKPDKNIHDFIIHFEPNTGVPVGGNIRLQISFYLPKNEKIDLVKNVNPVLIPLIWFDETLEIDSDIKNQLKTVSFYINLATVVPIVIGTTGLLLFSTIILIIMKRYFSLKKNYNVPDERTMLLNSDE